MSDWHTLRCYRTDRFIVALEWSPETDSDLSWMDESDIAKIQSGEWINCCFRVAVWLDNHMIASDHLGNSVYADPAEFSREHFGIKQMPGVGCYYSDMLRQTIAEARNFIVNRPAMPRVRS